MKLKTWQTHTTDGGATNKMNCNKQDEAEEETKDEAEDTTEGDTHNET